MEPSRSRCWCWIDQATPLRGTREIVNVIRVDPTHSPRRPQQVPQDLFVQAHPEAASGGNGNSAGFEVATRLRRWWRSRASPHLRDAEDLVKMQIYSSKRSSSVSGQGYAKLR